MRVAEGGAAVTTHPDTCPMREGDSRRRALVHFVGGPLCGLDAWLPPLRGASFVVGPPMFFGLPLDGKHRYRVVDAHRVEHLEAL